MMPSDNPFKWRQFEPGLSLVAHTESTRPTRLREGT